jgi:hypothetical protein
MSLSGNTVCDEVAIRIANRLAANGSGAGSIINFTNDALGLISAASSWVWDQTLATGILPVGGGLVSYTSVPNMDLGKKIAVWDSGTGVPIGRSDQGDYQSAGAGYVLPSSPIYNTFRVSTDSSTTNPILYMLPSGTSPSNVDISYHFMPPVLVYGPNPSVRWQISAMDALLKDWATAMTMQWLKMAGWDTLWADCLGRIKEFRRMYSTERENTGPEDESASEVQSKATIGRA